MSADVNDDATAERIEVKSVVKDFLITGTSVVARRTVVDMAKCNKCHERLSLHGGARTDEPQLCVMCHNPNATDISRRPRADLTVAASPGPCAGQVDALSNPALANAVNCDPAAGGSIDGKKEESIDFKHMIHGIHASSKRQKGLVVYGFYSGAGPANPVDFSHARFPGILQDCTTCHTTTSYQLTGIWESPTQSGVLGSTINSSPLTTDSLLFPTDDLNISPTTAACTSCHDDIDTNPKLAHLVPLGLAQFMGKQADINNSPELCVTCHGSGSGIADVKVVHGVK
jgi:OmcA/MtrC family decaheme c-type cytochrome